jgi:hypothetical protein
MANKRPLTTGDFAKMPLKPGMGGITKTMPYTPGTGTTKKMPYKPVDSRDIYEKAFDSAGTVARALNTKPLYRNKKK